MYRRPTCAHCDIDLSDYAEEVQDWEFCSSTCEREWHEKNENQDDVSL